MANIIFNIENLGAFIFRSGRQKCPLSQLLSNIISEFLAHTLRREKQIRDVRIGKEE